VIENSSNTNARGHSTSQKHMTIRNDARDRFFIEMIVSNHVKCPKTSSMKV